MNQFDQAPVNGEAIEESIAIVCNGNTAPKAIATGQYLFIKNHSTLATGGYHATDAIASGDTLSSSNVTSDPDGIANAINGKIPAVVNNLTSDSTTDALSAAQGKALNSKLNTNSGEITVPRTTGNTNSFYKYSKIGNVVTVYIEHHASDATINAWGNLDFPGIPSGFRPIQDVAVPAATDRSGSSGMIFTVFPSGVVRLNCKYNAMNDSSDIVRSTVTYAVSF